MDKLFIDANTTTKLSTSGGVSVAGVSVTNGDTVLFAYAFTETPPGSTETSLSLTGANALRIIARSQHAIIGRLWTFQDSYNQGNYPAGENLPTGKVTWLASFAPIDYAITAVSPGVGGTFTVAGDQELQILDGDKFDVTGSSNNNFEFTVSDVTYDGTTSSVITVVEEVFTVADGDIEHSALTNQLNETTNASQGFVDGFVEVSWLDPGNIPQTLSLLGLRVFAQLDDGATGTPPPIPPTYLTATEIEGQTIKSLNTGSNIDVKSTGFTDLTTVASGKWNIVKGIYIVTKVLTGSVTTNFSFRLGTDSDDDQIITTDFPANPSAIGDTVYYDVSGAKALLSAEDLRFTVDSISDATTHEIQVIPEFTVISEP